jgi:hypothetical protein
MVRSPLRTPAKKGWSPLWTKETRAQGHPGPPSTLLTLGENRHATVTLADRLMVTDMVVILRGM